MEPPLVNHRSYSQLSVCWRTCVTQTRHFSPTPWMPLLHSADNWPGPHLSFWSLLRHLQDGGCSSSFSHARPSPPLLLLLSLPPRDSSLLPMPTPPNPVLFVPSGRQPFCLHGPCPVLSPSSPAPVSLLLLGAAPPRVAYWRTGQRSWPTPLWVVMWAYCVPDPTVGPFTTGRFL